MTELSLERALAPREREVVALLVEGVTSTAALAEALCISPHTAHWHLNEIRRKLGLRDRVQIVAWAYRSGLLGDPSSPERKLQESLPVSPEASSVAPSAWATFLQMLEPFGA